MALLHRQKLMAGQAVMILSDTNEDCGVPTLQRPGGGAYLPEARRL